MKANLQTAEPEALARWEAMGLYDQIKSLFHDIIAPEIHALRSDIRRVDIRIDGVERELRVAIDIRERLAALEARRA